MLSEKDIQVKIDECGGDALYLHGHAVKAGYAWEIILGPPDLRAWEAYQAHKLDPAAQFALVQSMIKWCGSDLLKVPEDARMAFSAVRARFVGVAEAITNEDAFLQFIGLEAHAFEK